MYKLKKNVTIIITVIMVLLFGTMTINLANTVNSTNQYTNNTISEESKEESAATKLIGIKEEQLKSLDDYKAKYGSDTYGMAAYVLHLIQIYSIPIGLVGIAFCAIYEYVIGMKRLDIRDKGFNLIIAFVTILVIAQVLPLVFTIVTKGWVL